MEEKARYKSQELVTKIKDGTITAEDLDLVFIVYKPMQLSKHLGCYLMW